MFLGRARYQRRADAPQARAGSRNGYQDSTIKTMAGPVTIERPKLRGTTEAFASQLFGKTVTKSHALEALVIAGFVRGLSIRDVVLKDKPFLSALVKQEQKRVQHG